MNNMRDLFKGYDFTPIVPTDHMLNMCKDYPPRQLREIIIHAKKRYQESCDENGPYHKETEGHARMIYNMLSVFYWTAKNN